MRLHGSSGAPPTYSHQTTLATNWPQCDIRTPVADDKSKSLPTEKARQKTLNALQILHTAPEPVFDKLTQLAAHVAQVPFAAISFTGPNEQWRKAEYGWTTGSTPRDQSPCAISVERSVPIIAENALEHEAIRH